MSESKVLILSLGRRGGSVRYGKSIIDSMEQIPKEVFVSSFCIEKHPRNSIAIPTYRNKFEFILSSSTVLVCFWAYILIGLFRGKYKVLYTPYTHYWNVLFILTFRCFGLRSVSTVHDGIPHTGEGNWWEKAINYTTLRRSSHLIFLTEHVQRFLKSKVGFKGESTVIPHGLIQVEGVQEKQRTLDRPISLLFLGRVCHYKGLDLLLEALEQFDITQIEKLVISGEISQDQRHMMQEVCHIPIVWRDHWVSESEMADDINRAHVLVLPYREATQSGVASIGFAAGLPMICTRTGGLIEQCRDRDTILVDPTPTSIGKGILRLFNEPELYQTLQKNMAEKREQLTWKAIANSVLECL